MSDVTTLDSTNTCVSVSVPITESLVVFVSVIEPDAIHDAEYDSDEVVGDGSLKSADVLLEAEYESLVVFVSEHDAVHTVPLLAPAIASSRDIYPFTKLYLARSILK